MKLEGARRDLIVYFGSDWWDISAGTDRHMALTLGRYGPVLYVEPPLSVLTRLRHPAVDSLSAQPSLRVVTPRLARLLAYVVPGMTWPFLHRLVGPMVGFATRAAIDRLYGRPARPGTNESKVAAVVSSRVDLSWNSIPTRRKIFYCTDDLLSGAALWGLPQQRVLRSEAAMLRSVDAVAVVSPILKDRYASLGVFTTVIPNGCDPDAYSNTDSAPWPCDVSLKSPIVGFVGLINDRIDLALLEAVADTGHSLLLVGRLARDYSEADRFSTLCLRPNVCWVGAKAFSELPSYLRVIDVGLTPYRDSDFNRASFPLKTLEYLAAGRGVVSSPLPATAWLGTELVEVGTGPSEYASRVKAALMRPRTSELVAQRRSFAHEHSWLRRGDLMAKLLHIVA